MKGGPRCSLKGVELWGVEGLAPSSSGRRCIPPYASSGSKDPNNRVLGPKFYNLNGIWALKPYYLGALQLIVHDYSSKFGQCMFSSVGPAPNGGFRKFRVPKQSRPNSQAGNIHRVQTLRGLPLETFARPTWLPFESHLKDPVTVDTVQVCSTHTSLGQNDCLQVNMIVSLTWGGITDPYICL